MTLPSKPSHQPNHSFSLPLIICGITILLILLLGAFYLTKRKTNTSFASKIFPTTAQDTITSWETYENNTYKFESLYPPDYDMYQVSPELVNFRHKNDQTPAVSGFSIFVANNPENKDLKTICQTLPAGADFNGILCSSSVNIQTETVNGLPWEKIGNNTIGFVPTGYVMYAIAHNSLLYFLVDYSNQPEIIDTVVQNFKLIE